LLQVVDYCSSSHKKSYVQNHIMVDINAVQKELSTQQPRLTFEGHYTPIINTRVTASDQKVQLLKMGSYRKNRGSANSFWNPWRLFLLYRTPHLPNPGLKSNVQLNVSLNLKLARNSQFPTVLN
ncbi:hypothetical protein TNCV_1814371, partial [Trichonephila clavipes]